MWREGLNPDRYATACGELSRKRGQGKRGQGTISDFGIQAEWDAVTHARDLGGLRLLVSIPAGEDGAVVSGWFNGIRSALRIVEVGEWP